jgi:pimeloyl-ACP methyl ester carboxylesterase
MSEPEAPSLTRRGALSAAAATGIAALGSAPAIAQARKTFVLIHGAYHGGWCWRRVADLLEERNHKVFAPSLTGCGDRSHLISSSIVLDTHIADVVNIFKWEDLKDVCLCVHSYGGWPGTGALEEIGDRVSSIVWLDAFIPENGQRGVDYVSEFSRKALEAAVAKGEPGRSPPKSAQFGVNPKDQAWVDSKLSWQPNGVALQPIKLTGAIQRVAKKIFIRAPGYKQPAFDKAYAACKPTNPGRHSRLRPDTTSWSMRRHGWRLFCSISRKVPACRVAAKRGAPA